ncbi:MAG: hypothetical protein AAB250_00215 [Bdellovibrionota bacterium]
MSKFIFAVLISICTCGSAQAFTCIGAAVSDTGSAMLFYKITIDRRATDLKPGIPVSVTVDERVVDAVGVNEPVTVIEDASGRMSGFPDAGSISVEFDGHRLEANAVSADSGSAHYPRLQGTLQFSQGRLAIVSCPAE